MIGLEKVWKAVKRQGDAADQRMASTVARDVTAPRHEIALKPSTPTEVEPSETRAADRFVPLQTVTALVTASGKRIPARIINISRSAVALEAELGDFRPSDIASVGTRPVVPGRRIALGMVFLFRKPLDPKLCNPAIVL